MGAPKQVWGHRVKGRVKPEREPERRLAVTLEAVAHTRYSVGRGPAVVWSTTQRGVGRRTATLMYADRNTHVAYTQDGAPD